MVYRGKPKGSYGNQKHGRSSWRGSGKAKRDSKLAMESFEGRSKRSQSQDLHKYAEIAPIISVYLKSPGEWDWQGIDTPDKLAGLAKKGSVEMVVKDSSEKGKSKSHHFKIARKTKAKKEPEKAKETEKPKEKLAKVETNSPIIEGQHMPSQAEILAKA